MTVPPLRSNSDHSAPKGLGALDSGNISPTHKRGGKAAESCQRATTLQDNEADEDAHLKQYMEQFFKAYKIGEFSAGGSRSDGQASTPVLNSPASGGSAVAGRSVMPTVELNRPAEPAAPAPGEANAADMPRKAAQPRDPARPTKAPESIEDLRQLRRLVNTTVRRAIKQHAFRQSIWLLRVYLTLGLVSTACSIVLLSIASHTLEIAYLLGVGVFLVATLACFRYLCLLRHAERAARKESVRPG